MIVVIRTKVSKTSLSLTHHSPQISFPCPPPLSYCDPFDTRGWFYEPGLEPHEKLTDSSSTVSESAIGGVTIIMGLSLWIVPDSRDAEKLKPIMGVVENNPSHTPAYPKFHPHITLASFPASMESDLESIMMSIPTSPVPLRCNFASLTIESHYFRSVYIAIKPTSQMLDLHIQVHETLRVNPRTPSFPHMSLCYIDDADAAKGEKEIFYYALKDAGKFRVKDSQDFEGDGISLDCGSEKESEDWMDFFDAQEVWAVRCEGRVEEWVVLEKISLKKPET